MMHRYRVERGEMQQNSWWLLFPIWSQQNVNDDNTCPRSLEMSYVLPQAPLRNYNKSACLRYFQPITYFNVFQFWSFPLPAFVFKRNKVLKHSNNLYRKSGFPIFLGLVKWKTVHNYNFGNFLYTFRYERNNFKIMFWRSGRRVRLQQGPFV